MGLDALQPLINWNALKAAYGMANARQRQALLAYKRTLLSAYTEVQTQLARLRNAVRSYTIKQAEVQMLFGVYSYCGSLAPFGRRRLSGSAPDAEWGP